MFRQLFVEVPMCVCPQHKLRGELREERGFWHNYGDACPLMFTDDEFRAWLQPVESSR